MEGGARRGRGSGRRQRGNGPSPSPSASTPRVITSIDCASFEVVRARRGELEALLGTGAVDILFCNEEEAAALAEGAEEEAEGKEARCDDEACEGGGGGGGSSSSSGNTSAVVVSRALRRALDLGARVAVASLGPAGATAMVKKRRKGSGEEEKDSSSFPFDFCCYSCPAEAVDSVADTVGAGDAFAAGFLSSLLLSGSSSSSSKSSEEEEQQEEAEEEEEAPLFLRGEAIEAALRLGCAAGAAAVRASGADPGKEAWDSVAAKVKVKGREQEKARELVQA